MVDRRFTFPVYTVFNAARDCFVMARTTPARTENFSRSPGEGRVCRALEGLPDRVFVIHSQPWWGAAGERRGEGEADFVIVDPDAGVLVVEVKGGSIACQDGVWLQGRGDAPPSKVIEPYVQVRGSMHALQKRISAEVAGSEKVLFGHLVWFPDVDLTDAPLPGGTPRELTLDQRHLAAPEAAIEGAFAYWRTAVSWKRGACGEVLAQAIRDYLAPSFEGRPAPAAEAPPPSPPPPVEPRRPGGAAVETAPKAPSLVDATSHIWGAALAWSGEVLLRAGKAILLAPVRFAVEVVDIVAKLVAGLVGWCWNGLKTGLMLGFACGLAVGVVALVLRFGFHKEGAMAFVYGGFGGSFLAFVSHELGERLEAVAADLAADLASRWRDYRELLSA
jgi:hypothetical protein